MNTTLDLWNISGEDFPAIGTPVEQMEFVLNYAVLAPSNHNTQPWLFEIHGDAIHLFVDRSRALPMTDPEDREMLISCGAALLNLRVAMRHFGVLGAVETLAVSYGLSAWRDALTFGVMFAILVVRPAGLFGARALRSA